MVPGKSGLLVVVARRELYLFPTLFTTVCKVHYSRQKKVPDTPERGNTLCFPRRKGDTPRLRAQEGESPQNFQYEAGPPRSVSVVLRVCCCVALAFPYAAV